MNRQPEKIVPGVILIVFGLLFLLDRFDAADFGDVIRTFWPMMIIAMGVAKLFRHVWAGLWVLTVGVWLQLVTLNLFDLTYGNSWPLILIALGAGIILRTIIESVRAPRDTHETNGN